MALPTMSAVHIGVARWAAVGDKRFPGGAVQRVKVLQYGDEPMIEPGELLVRLIVAAADGRKGQELAPHAFEEAHDGAREPSMR